MNKSIASLLLAAVATASITVAAEPSPVGNVLDSSHDQFRFAEQFSDEFDRDQLDAQKWNTNTGSASVKGPTGKPRVAKKMSSPKQGQFGWDKEKYIAMEKTKWEANSWPWNQEEVEANFAEIDTNQDGVASGLERQAWFKKKSTK